MFAYGSTGSGKTYTMMGSDGSELDRLIDQKANARTPTKLKKNVSTPYIIKSKGLITLALEDLFSNIESITEKRYSLSVSYMEIYNEQIFDLLINKNRMSKDVLTICED